MGRGPEVVVAVLVAITLVGCDSDPPASAYRWEGIEAFALWPEDDPEIAQEACARREDDEEWRTTPEGVAETFVREVLGWDQPDVEEVDEREESPRTAITAFDASFPRYALGLVIHLRRLDDCWFVAVIQPREGEVVLEFDYGERGGRPAVAVTREGGEGPRVIELGYAGESERKILAPDETAVFYVENTDSVGHYVTYPPEPSELSQGYPLEPYEAACAAERGAASCD